MVAEQLSQSGNLANLKHTWVRWHIFRDSTHGLNGLRNKQASIEEGSSESMMLGGYVGKILYVDLTSRDLREERISEDVARKYLGGSGLGARILYDLTRAQTNALGPENLLIFMNGPLTGTKIPLSGRHQVVAKSPLTSIYGESDVGGTWGSQLKKAGYDGLVLEGRAEKPTYLWICDGTVEFRDATHLWGMDTYEVDETLKKETDLKAVTNSIGPAGERLTRIAGIMTDGRDGRASARCGLGAVMGSKNVKSIVAKGSKEVPLANPEGLMHSIRECSKMIVDGTKSLHLFGTSGGTVAIEQLGDMPVKNWLEGRFEEGAKRISGTRMAESILVGRYYCGACIVGCGRRVKIEHGPYALVDGAGPEYETMACIGATNLVDDLKAIAKAHELCNRYGLDVISTGQVIGFAFEAYERGLITAEDTGGLTLRWGDPASMIELVRRIGEREGIGWLLGEGVKRAADRIGGIAPEFALHVKGLELPGHDPRAYNSVGLAYATSNRGACHLQAASHLFERTVTMPDLGYPQTLDRFGVDGKGEFVAKMQDLMCIFDSAKLCKFLLFGEVKVWRIVEWLNLVTGWNLTAQELMKVGERIYNLKRMYNVRCGVSRKDDTLPPRVLTHKRGCGGAASNLPPLSTMLSDYYAYRGWDEMGIPTEARLTQLGLTPSH